VGDGGILLSDQKESSPNDQDLKSAMQESRDAFGAELQLRRKALDKISRLNLNGEIFGPDLNEQSFLNMLVNYYRTEDDAKVRLLQNLNRGRRMQIAGEPPQLVESFPGVVAREQEQGTRYLA